MFSCIWYIILPKIICADLVFVHVKPSPSTTTVFFFVFLHGNINFHGYGEKYVCHYNTVIMFKVKRWITILSMRIKYWIKNYLNGGYIMLSQDLIILYSYWRYYTHFHSYSNWWIFNQTPPKNLIFINYLFITSFVPN